MIDSIIDRLKKLDLDLTPEEIADILWLGIQMHRAAPPPDAEDPSDQSGEIEQSKVTVLQDVSSRIPRSSVSQAPTTAYLSTSSDTGAGNIPKPSRTVVFKTPEAPALRNPLLLARAMRPLMQKYPSRTRTILDEEATVNRIADNKIWLPVEIPAPERWFDLVMVVEESASVAIWQKAIAEWQQLVKHHGAFRDVRTWYLREGSRANWQLYPTSRATPTQSRPRNPKELLEASGRQLILLVSDCVSSLWQQGTIYPLLETWIKQSSVSILQLMPERYWERSVLGRGRFVQFGTFLPEPLNTQLWVEALPVWKAPLKFKKALKLPVITFDPNSLEQWAKVMTGNGKTTTAGVVFESSQTMTNPSRQSATDQLSGAERVKRFRATASLPARQLAGLMAVAPVSLPVARLIQQTMLPNSNQAHLAEVFLSGLIRVADEADMDLDTEQIRYQFLPDVRESLLQAVPVSDADEVLDRVSDYIARRAGLSIQSFDALLEMYPTLNEEKRQLIEPFAQVTPQVLRRLGGTYAEIADELEFPGGGGTVPSGETRIPATLETFEFDVATISIQGNRAKIFISCRSQDPDMSLAQEFYQALVAAGHEPFMAGESIRLGENWSKRIDTALEHCDCFLLLLSPQSAVSEMVIEEVRRAKQLKDTRPDRRPIIMPIRVNFPWDSPLNYDLRGYLNRIQQREWKTEADTAKILQEILTFLAAGSSPSPTFAEPEEPDSQSLTPYPLPPLNSPPLPSAELELPGGQVDLASVFYVEREPIEADCYEAIARSGALIRIKAPRQMGKTSLLLRILQQAKELDYLTVPLSFQLADTAVFGDLDKFLRWFCASVGRRLRLPNRLNDYWDEIFGSKDNCTAYFEEYLLNEINRPLALGLDEVDYVFQHPKIADDFLGLLRAWHEDAKSRNLWKKLRLVVVHSTEVYIPLNINQSPFNIGLPIELPEFTPAQVLDLAQRHRLNWKLDQVEQLMNMVGGHPYLVRVALYQIARGETTLTDLLQSAPTEAGLYGDHLRRHLWNLEQRPELAKAVKVAIASPKPVRLEPMQAFQLHSMGLVHLKGNDVQPRCDLYRRYFGDRLRDG